MQRSIDFTLADILTVAQTVDSSSAFANALKFTLPQEGIYFENVPGDTGGDTCCGVDQPDYDFYRRQMGEALQSVASITAEEVAKCYYHNHWQPLDCDDYEFPVALALFDDGVNQGNGEAARCLQRALGVTADGIIGSGTQAAEHDYVVKHGAIALAGAMLDQRRAVYREIVAAHPGDGQFLQGWFNRCDALAQSIAE